MSRSWIEDGRPKTGQNTCFPLEKAIKDANYWKPGDFAGGTGLLK